MITLTSGGSGVSTTGGTNERAVRLAAESAARELTIRLVPTATQASTSATTTPTRTARQTGDHGRPLTADAARIQRH